MARSASSTRADIALVLALCQLTAAGRHHSHSPRDFSDRAAKADGSYLGSFLSTALLPDQGMTEAKLPEPLMQTAMTYFQTLPEEVDPVELIEKLGDHFDAAWMSIDRPYENLQQVGVDPDLEVSPDLLADIRTLNFSYRDEHDRLVSMTPDIQRVLEKWLLQKATCPVHYHWDDVGPLFWPRWLRKGTCGSDSQCSWPPGMMCVPSPRPMTIRILRWNCRSRRRRVKPAARVPPASGNRKRKNQRRKNQRDRTYDFKCRWKKVRYPITTNCYCTC